MQIFVTFYYRTNVLERTDKIVHPYLFLSNSAYSINPPSITLHPLSPALHH